MKRILLLLLAFTMIFSLAACKKEPDNMPIDSSGPVEEEGEEETYEDPWNLPEVTGFEKRVRPEIVTYSSPAGSMIIVQSPPVDDETKQALLAQDLSAEILQKEINAILGSLNEEETVTAEFQSIGHGDVLTASITLETETIIFYKLVGADGNVYDIISTDRNNDTPAVLTQIAETLQALHQN